MGVARKWYNWFAGGVQIDISIPQNASTAAAIGGGVVHSNSGAGSSSGWIALGRILAVVMPV